MDLQQLSTLEITEQGDDKKTVETKLLKVKQEQWIKYCALWGLITLESDDPTKLQEVKVMTIGDFAKQIGVDRTTLYYWKKSIPNFSDKVREARNQVFSDSRESVLFNRAYMIALTSKDHKAAGEMIKMLLGHGAKLELPVQRQEVKHEGEDWASFMARKRQEVVEGEVVNTNLGE